MAVNDAVAVRHDVDPWIAPRSAKPTGRKRLSYDRWSDTLFLEFYDEPRRAISVPAEDGDRDHFYLRLDPKTDEIVGVQIEAFLGYAVGHDPPLWAWIVDADIEGIADLETADLKQRARLASPELSSEESYAGAIARRMLSRSVPG